MISKGYGRYMLLCDLCGQGSDVTFDTFQDAVDEKSDIDWISQMKGEEWQDICPDCREL